MDMVELLKGVAVFEGLTDDELKRVAGICRVIRCRRGDPIMTQGDEGSEMFVVQDGLVEVRVGPAARPLEAVVNLGTGQVVGEMALVDYGPRSATVRCATDTATLAVIDRDAFEQLCEADHHMGMLVYRNLAADLSFKLRHRHLARR